MESDSVVDFKRTFSMMTMTMRNEDVEPCLSVSGQKTDRKRTRSRRLPRTWFTFVNIENWKFLKKNRDDNIAIWQSWNTGGSRRQWR